VENAGTLAAKIKLNFTVEDGGLMDALWFDFVQVKGGAVVGAFQKRPMSELETIADGMELPLLANENVLFILIDGMDESAGNAFMEKTFSADVAIVATQYTEEKDGFGSNQYDKDAAYAWTGDTDDESYCGCCVPGHRSQYRSASRPTKRSASIHARSDPHPFPA